MSAKDEIWNSNNTGMIDENHLLAYLEGTMPPAEQHRLEEILESDPFLNDAVEGLFEVKDKEQLKLITQQINIQLSKQIKNRKKKRRSRNKLTEHWGWLYILIVLILVMLAWWVIHVMVKK